MSWQRLLASAVVLGTVAGCQTPSDPQPLQAGPVTTTAKTTEGTPTVPRAQKPDAAAPPTTVPASFLDSKPEPGVGNLVATIRATVNGVPILDQDIRAVANTTNPDDLRKALNLLIERELVLQDCYGRFGKGPNAKFLDKLKEAAAREFDRQVVAKSKAKLNLKTDEEFKTWLKTSGVSLDTLRKQWEKQFIYQQYIQVRVAPYMERIGHDEIREFYDKHPEEFETGDRVEWQDIFIAAARFANRDEARKTAQQIEARMKQGEEIAKLLPFDHGDSTYRGGDGLGNKRHEIRPGEAEPVLFQLKEKEAAIVEIAGGYHVVRVVKREQAGRMPFDEKAQNMIRDKLKQEVFAREAKQYLNELKRQAAIEIAKDGL